MPRVAIASAILLAQSFAVAAFAQAEPRQSVLFETAQTTSTGQSIFLLGDLPELGGGDMTRAVKLDPSGYPNWRITISLPAGRTYTYRYVRRSDAPAQASLASNGTFLTAPQTASTAPVPRSPATKTLLLTWNVPNPVLRWRPATVQPEAAAPFAPLAMRRYGPSLNARQADTVWLAWGFQPAGLAYDFFFTDAAGTSRYPQTGWYTTSLDGAFVQDGQLYTYIPAPAVTPARRDYSPSSVPTLFSTQLSESRGYRVYLPRGYDQHPTRRYPVLYMHDGQNVFESGPFGSWNAAPTVATLQAQGRLREVIVVGLDNGPDRIRDYTPPSDLGDGARYAAYIRDTVMPLVNGQYRTLTGGENTGALGSSMGALISLYLGWEHTSAFTRIGAMSGAWQVGPQFVSSVTTGPARPIRIYLDSGDSGPATDNFWPTYSIRDALAGSSSPRYAIEGALRHRVGFAQQHNEAAWAARLPDCLTFLFPASEESSDLLASVFNPTFDVDGDGDVTVEDLYAQAAAPRDLNLDGVISQPDTDLLERFLRRAEPAGMAGPQRP